MALERKDVLNEKRKAALDVTFMPGGRLCNTGYCGIGVKNGGRYSFYMFAKAEAAVRLTISVAEGAHCFGRMEFRLPAQTGESGYLRYQGSFVADGDSRKARLCLLYTSRCV